MRNMMRMVLHNITIVLACSPSIALAGKQSQTAEKQGSRRAVQARGWRAAGAESMQDFTERSC